MVAPLARISNATHPFDASGRLFVPDMRGDIWLVSGGVPTVYLDVAAEFADFDAEITTQTGLTFVAFHTDFANNGIFYTGHTEAGAALAKVPDYSHPLGDVIHGVVTEWSADDPEATIFSGPHRELLRIGFGTYHHTLTQVHFEDGHLFISVGDGDFAPATSTGPRDLSLPHGKILRIDPAGSNGPNGSYGIPTDNPLVDSPGVIGEIWAYGLRNPHRFSWDPITGRMFIGNIGQSNIDAIYLGMPGADYGWNEREGTFLWDPAIPENVYPLPAGDEAFGYSYPIAQYDHDEGFAVMGGFVYRGSTIPEMYGHYVFGDLVNGRLFHVPEHELVLGSQATIHELSLVDESDASVTLLGLVADFRVDLRFGLDEDGEILVLNKRDGRIWRIESTDPVPEGVDCPEPATPFTDVPETSFAAGDIACIYGLGITTGTSDTKYSPDDYVTREQMAAFEARLWRALGLVCPQPATPFTDVSSTSFAIKDISCIYGLGITTGTSDTEYSPGDYVTREQMAAFEARLWRALGLTCPTGFTPFTDVSAASFAVADVACIFGLGITTGTSLRMYSPDQYVTREQMAAFVSRLWRLAAAG